MIGLRLRVEFASRTANVVPLVAYYGPGVRPSSPAHVHGSFGFACLHEHSIGALSKAKECDGRLVSRWTFATRVQLFCRRGCAEEVPENCEAPGSRSSTAVLWKHQCVAKAPSRV